MENKETTYEYNYNMGTISDQYEIYELPEGSFPLSSKIIDKYQQKEPCIKVKIKCTNFNKIYRTPKYMTLTHRWEY